MQELHSFFVDTNSLELPCYRLTFVIETVYELGEREEDPDIDTQAEQVKLKGLYLK